MSDTERMVSGRKKDDADGSEASLRPASLADFLTRLDPNSLSQGNISSPLPFSATAVWRIEACVGATPLTTVAVGGRPGTHRLPVGSLAVVSARLATESGPWLGACPFVLGGDGPSSRPLADGIT